jgi:hypothetical protein
MPAGQPASFRCLAALNAARHASDQAGSESTHVAYAAELTVSCLISYAIVTRLLALFVARSDNLLGGMWVAGSAW